MPNAISTTGLSRRFAGGHGVSDLDLHVPEGSIYGFLGPNGAGKTTTIRLLLDLLVPDAGTIELFGERTDRAHRAPLAHVGALVEMPSLYGHLTGRENLEVTRRLLGAGRARIASVLQRVGLVDSADRPVREYSLGMRQRLAIALALLGEPRLLVLDEPGNGLDPAGIVDMRALLRGLAQEGITVFVSSHLLAEIEQVATHVGVLQSGRLRFEGTIGALRGRVKPRLAVRCDAIARASALLAAAGQGVTHDGDTLFVALEDRSESEINALLVSNGIAVSHLAREQASLETMFFDLTRQQPEAEAA